MHANILTYMYIYSYTHRHIIIIPNKREYNTMHTCKHTHLHTSTRMHSCNHTYDRQIEKERDGQIKRQRLGHVAMTPIPVRTRFGFASIDSAVRQGQRIATTMIARAEDSKGFKEEKGGNIRVNGREGVK